MSNYKRFWQNKPILRKAVAIFLLITMPVMLPIIVFCVAWREVVQAYVESYRETWGVITEKSDD